jgi:hypothetical protein
MRSKQAKAEIENKITFVLVKPFFIINPVKTISNNGGTQEYIH